MAYLGHTRSRGRRRSEIGLALSPELSSEDVEFEAAPLGRVDRTVWLRSDGVGGVGESGGRGGLHWEGLALGLGRPGESLHCLCSAGAIPSLSRPLPDFHWVLF